MFCEKLTKLRLFTCHETIGPSLYLLIEYCDNRLKVFWVSDCRLCNVINMFYYFLKVYQGKQISSLTEQILDQIKTSLKRVCEVDSCHDMIQRTNPHHV